MVKRHFSRLGVPLWCVLVALVTYLQRYHQLPGFVIAGDTNEQWMNSSSSSSSSSSGSSDMNSGQSSATQTEPAYESTTQHNSFIEISPKCKSTSITIVERGPNGELGIEWLGEPDWTVKHFYNITWVDQTVGRTVSKSGGIYKLTTFALPTRNQCEIVELSVCRGDWRRSQPCVCGVWVPQVDALSAVTVLKVPDGGYVISWQASKCVKQYQLRPGDLTFQLTNSVAVEVLNVRDCQWNRFVVETVMQNGAIGQQEVQFYGYPLAADTPRALCGISKIRNVSERWNLSTLELSKVELNLTQLEHYMTSCVTPTTADYLDVCGLQAVQRSNQVRKADALPHVIPPYCTQNYAHSGDVTVKPGTIGEVRDLRANTDLDRTVILSWRPPREERVCVKEYIITWASESEIVDAEQTTYTVTNLEPCTTYNFTVSAIDHNNAKGTPSSIEARVREIEQLSEVVELELYEVEPRSLSAKWKPPLNGTNCVQSYRVAAWYNSPEDASVVLVFSNTTTDQHVTFGEAIACMTYMVQVIPISFQNKDGRNEIAPLKTKERTILPYHVEPIRAIGVRARSLELSTKLQSDNNNNCLLVSVRFNCTIVPEAEDSAPELPVIKEFAIPSGNVSFEGVVEPLVPYTVYQCNAQILNIAGWSDPTPSYEIQTAEDVPESPRRVQLIAGSGFIEITWMAPAIKNGVVVRYRIHIRMIGPEYPMPKLCDQLEQYNETVDLRDEIDPDETHRSWDGAEFQYTITQLAPYTLYTVQVAAATGAGVGAYSEPSEIITLPDVPSEARNFRIEQIRGPELDQAYSSSVEFSWEIPCRLNGKLRRFEGTLDGVRETSNSVPHVLRWVVEVDEEDDLLEPFRYIETRLKPEYMYTVAMNVTVAEVPEPSPDALLTFESPAGIPTIDQTDEWFKVDVFDAPNPTNTARIVLGNITLKSDIGSIRYMALLVSERFCQSDPEPRTDFINSEGTTQWPEVPDWHRVNNMRCTEQYQTTPKFWNPLLHLSRANADPVEFVVGEERCDNGKEYCNGPLKPGTEYALVVRIFSRTGFTDSELQFFRTDSLIMVGLIISSIVACCLLAFISGLVILWRRQRLLLPAQLAGRTPSEEPSDIPLKNFPSQYDELFQSNREKVSKEFQTINYFSDTELQETVSYHSARENERKNRYVNILPYDSNRVLLDSNEEEDEYDGRSGTNDYINASFIEGYKYQREYIATQGPKLETCADFWRMVIQYEIEAIVMLTQPIDHEKNKCCQYYPRYQQKIRFNDIRVECKQELKLLFYHKRLFEVTQGNLTKLVFHYHFLEWPDHSCPASPTDLVKFTKIIRAERKSYAIPLVVHCSAGVGRTGTFIALDIILQRMQHEKKINVYDTVKQLRRQRVKMVQTLDQYTFLYQCCLEQVSKSNRKKPKSSFIEIVDRESQGKHASPLATVIEVEQPGVAVSSSNGGKPLFNIKFPKSFNAGLEKVTSFAPSDMAGSGT